MKLYYVNISLTENMYFVSRK